MKLSNTVSIALGLLSLRAFSHAQTNPFAKGPDPTSTGLETDEPSTVSTQNLRGNGFGEGLMLA